MRCSPQRAPGSGKVCQNNKLGSHDLSQERAKGFEPSTSALGRLHSTTELRPQRCQTIDQNRGMSTSERWLLKAWRGTPWAYIFDHMPQKLRKLLDQKQPGPR